MKNNITAYEFKMYEREREGDEYHLLLDCITDSFNTYVKNGEEPLFVANAPDLYEIFLNELPAEARQHYNCNACRHFVNRYGRLVRINEKGKTIPVMWGSAPAFFVGAVGAVYRAVAEAPVIGVFVTDNRALGLALTGPWRHMAVDMPAKLIHHNVLKTPYQKSAEKEEEFRMLKDANAKYSIQTVEKAVNILRSDTLYSGEKVLGVAEWFLDIKKELKGKRENARKNILWKKVAMAPAGFCHISSTMIGTLLDDIEAGYGIDAVSRRFAEKMNPLQYQRPQAAPTVGNVAQAENIVAKLGLERSLKRRYARLDEIQTIWMPRSARAAANTTGGVFSGVVTKGNAIGKLSHHDSIPTVTMTWEKFNRTVLPMARKIEYYVTMRRDSYGAIVTAADMDAPPIIQWDDEENRCPFNWYIYHSGSMPSNWGLTSGWVEVTGIALQPSMWKKGFEHHGKSVFFILKGCKDHHYRTAGSALFPSTLRSELHDVRATIEAYSNANPIDGFEDSSACGIRLQANTRWWDYTFRVTSDVGVTTYKLDRWD